MGEKEEFESRNYYELLGVERSATVEEIREAYREIARIYHPDSNYYGDILSYGLTEKDNRIFRLVTAAYDTLVKADKRAKYDLTLPPEMRDWDAKPFKDQQEKRPTGPMREWNAPSSMEEVDLLRSSKLREKSPEATAAHSNRFSTLHQKVVRPDNFGREARFAQEREAGSVYDLQRTIVLVASVFLVLLVIVAAIMLI